MGRRSGSAAGELDEAGTPVRRDECERRVCGAFTGPKATEWAGHKSGKFCTAQGNILAGPQVVANMIDAFENTKGHLSRRLVAALEGGQAGGGDKRGQQSAALVIVKKNCGVWLHNDTILRLQVDDSPEPIAELKRVVEKWNERKPRSVSPECRP
ncbi:MAG: hypothetical protein DMG04_27455 [Acidobacteria bacterium]|nr:MAG: hypothetical protein DMG04_27455 [Acidobacteriota bacterium]PYQ77952.1 MAG: hypothetical protein DMG03_29390 [Acidobacteriota bacterium]